MDREALVYVQVMAILVARYANRASQPEGFGCPDGDEQARHGPRGLRSRTVLVAHDPIPPAVLGSKGAGSNAAAGVGSVR